MVRKRVETARTEEKQWETQTCSRRLVAAAIGALSISAYAADVNVYGVIDYGMVYNHTRYEAGGQRFHQGRQLHDGFRRQLRDPLRSARL